MKLERGDILKLSEEGLEHLYKYDPKGRKRAMQWRWEYRCVARNDSDCISALRVGKNYRQVYHKSFLEKVE